MLFTEKHAAFLELIRQDEFNVWDVKFKVAC